MKIHRTFRLLALLGGFTFAAASFGANVSNAEIVANLGTLAVGTTETVTCNTTGCSTSAGTVGGSLPAPGNAFTHQIVFNVSPASSTLASNQVLLSTAIDVANMTVKLFLHDGVSATNPLGTAVASGGALATAVKSTFNGTTNFLLTFGALNPASTYFIEIFGGAGVLTSDASYTQQIAHFNEGGGPSPVPLPAALPLLLAALGALGFFGWRRRRAAA